MIGKFLKRYWPTLLGVAIGAVGGYLYWLYVGCNSGTCPITASPVNSAVWCAAIGGLLFNIFQKKKKSDE